jgi:hypothetical protein
MRRVRGLYAALIVAACTQNGTSDQGRPAESKTQDKVVARSHDESRRGVDGEAGGATQQVAASFPVVWSDALALQSLADVEARLAREEPSGFCELEKGDERVVASTCNRWLTLRAQGYEPSSVLEETGDAAALVLCGTLKRLQSASPAKRSFVRELKFDASVLPMLPAALASQFSKAREGEIEAAEKSQRSLRDVDQNARSKGPSEPHSLLIAEGDRTSTILVRAQAWGDFNGDGTDDVLVSVLNAMNEGTVRRTRLLLLSRGTKDDVLRVVSGS